MEQKEIRENSGTVSEPVRGDGVVLRIELPAGSMVLITYLSGKKTRRTE